MTSNCSNFSKFYLGCYIFLIVLVGASFYHAYDSPLENLISTPPATPSFFPTELTWGIGWGSENIDIAEDVWADEDAIYVVGSIEENTTTSKLMLSKFTQNIHMQREQIWSVNWSRNSATYGKGIWSNGSDIFTIGEYSDNFVLIKWNINGTEIWNSTWNLDGEFGRAHSVWGINNEIYVCGVYIDESCTH